MLVFNCSGKKNSSLVSQIKAKIFPTQKFLILPKKIVKIPLVKQKSW